MIKGTTGQRQDPSTAARLTSTPSPSTSSATGAFARSPRQGGQSRRRDGELEPAAPSTALDMRTMCGSRTDGWSLPCVMSD
jgi:hypothetical protein